MSFLETLVILIVAMIVLGPKRLPEVARKIGKWSGMIRRASDDFKRQLMTMDQTFEQTVTRETADLDRLVPDDELQETTSILDFNLPPPTTSPDDVWDTPAVPGGLAEEVQPAETVISTPEVATKPEIRLHPTSIVNDAPLVAPRSLGLSPTLPEKKRG